MTRGGVITAGLRAAPTEFGEAVLARAVAGLAAQTDLPIDRIDEAGLLAEEVAAGLARAGGPIAIAAAAGPRGLSLLLGPFPAGTARASAGAAPVPALGPLADRLADRVAEHPVAEGDLLELTFGAGDGPGLPGDLPRTLRDLGARTMVTGFVAALPATAAAVAVVRQMLTGAGLALDFDAEAIDDVKLAVSEACANVVVHAYPDAAAPGPLEVELRPVDGGLSVTVRDHGVGLSPHRPGSAREPSPTAGLGLGLELMATLSREMALAAGERGGTSVRLEFGAEPTA